MKRLLPILLMLASTAAFAINITNYPIVTVADPWDLFLMSDIGAKTNKQITYQNLAAQLSTSGGISTLVETNITPSWDVLRDKNGSEYLYHWFNMMRSNLEASVVFDGDSTTANGGNGNVGASYQYQNLTPVLVGPNLPFVSWYNIGIGGKDVVYWNTNNAAYSMTFAPDLLIVRWGINGPNDANGPTADFETNFRAALARIRSSNTVDKLSILVVEPNSTAQGDVGGASPYHGSKYHDMLEVIIRRAARDYKCAYLDIYSFLKDSASGQNLWIDNYMVHPNEEMQFQIAGAISDFIMPLSIRQYMAAMNPTTPTNGVYGLTGVITNYTHDPTGTQMITNFITIEGGLVTAWSGAYGGSPIAYPTNLNNLVLWLDASSVTNATDTQVATWYDLTTNHNNAVAYGVGPTFRSSEDYMNAKPAMWFTNNMMLITNAITARPYTMFIVANYPVASVPLKMILASGITNAFYFNANNPSDGQLRNFNGVYNSGTASGTMPVGTPFLTEITYAANTGPSFYINGTRLNPDTWFGASGNNGYNIGTNTLAGSLLDATQFFPGYISEIIIYRTVLGATDRKKIEAYLRDKYQPLW